MKKIFFATLLALLTLASCTKEDPAAWLDGTHWRYTYTENTGRKITCELGLKANSYNKGELVITDKYSSHYTEWNNNWRWWVSSYTYDGEHGTIYLSPVNAGVHEGNANFTLNYDQKKMYLNTPIDSYTLERTK